MQAMKQQKLDALETRRNKDKRKSNEKLTQQKKRQ